MSLGTLRIVFLSAILIAWSACPLRAQSEVSDDVERQTVVRALDYVASAGEAWMKKRGCVSCHQIPTMVWSHQHAGALDKGLPNTALRNWTDWSTQVVNFVKPPQKADVDIESAMSGNIDTMVALLLAVPQDGDEKWRDVFVKKLCQEQAEDGSWKACGQLPAQRRGVQETTAVTTLWSTYALMKHDAEFRRAKAIEFADQIESAVSTEWYATRLLVALTSESTSDSSATDSYRQSLLSHQNEDGGWGWRAGEESDALGTGYAMYALAVDGVAADAIVSAKEFLVKTQTESGKWIVPGTKKSAKGKPTETANDWGTAWAAIALLQCRL